MNARTIAQKNPPPTLRDIPAAAAPPSPRFNRKFIEDYNLVELYLRGKLPFKGARDLENWCRVHPGYLEELKLSERAQMSLKLLEAGGRPLDLREPKAPWWKNIYVLVGLCAISAVCLLAFWALLGKYVLLRGQLADLHTQMSQGTLVQPADYRQVVLTPDRAAGIDKARIIVSRSAPQLLDVHVDLNYTNKLTQFRMFVDKKDQGRALILNDLLKDSNGELRMTLNSTGLAAGIYNVRIEALPFRGSPIPVGWLILEVR